jgi:hypothetical protein
LSPQRIRGVTSRQGDFRRTTHSDRSDTLRAVGWLDLSNGPLVLYVPSIVDFAYVGTRTTDTQKGDYLISGPGWKGQVPSGTKQISSPTNSVLVIGRMGGFSRMI